MSPSIPTLIRQQLQANDAVQDPIDLEEIASRVEADEPVAVVSSAPHIASRNIWVAAAAAVITLLLLGLIPLLSGGDEHSPADTLPPPTTPTTAVPRSTIGDTESPDEGGLVVPQVFTAVPSDPLAVEGSLTWRTVELPAAGMLRVGLDDRIYLLTEDVFWVSDDGVDWTGYPAVPPFDGYLSAVGQGRLIGAGGGGGIGFSENDEEPDLLLPVTVAIYDVSDVNSGGVTLVAESPLPASDGDGPDSVAIGPQGAVVTTTTGVFYSEPGDQWTPVEGLPARNYFGATAASDGFYITDGATVFFSTDGMDWTHVYDLSSIKAIGRWGDGAVADDGETIWRLTPQGREALYTNDDRTGPSRWIWQITGSPLGIMSVQSATGRYLFSRDGNDWEDLPLPEGWAFTNVFVEEPIAMNSETILLIASATNSQDGAADGGNRVLMATP